MSFVVGRPVLFVDQLHLVARGDQSPVFAEPGHQLPNEQPTVGSLHTAPVRLPFPEFAYQLGCLAPEHAIAVRQTIFEVTFIEEASSD